MAAGRKQEESAFHDFVRSDALKQEPQQFEYYNSNKKFYSVTSASRAHYTEWLRARVGGKRCLDYACGNGGTSFLLAELGAREVVGIDISPVSVENATKEAAARGLSDRCQFRVMDAERLEFPARHFDVIVVMGVLHHLDIPVAFRELSRVVKEDGRVACLEALGHNPLFQLYRRRTPHLRTAWETDHIITRRELREAHKVFGRVDCRFFHLAALLAVPFRSTPLFGPLVAGLNGVDRVLMAMPGVKWQAWMVWFVLSEPVGLPAAGTLRDEASVQAR